VEVAELDETAGFVARLLGELPLGRLLERLPRMLAARRDLPVEVTGDVAVLAHEDHAVAVEEGEHADAFRALDDSVDGRLPAGELGDVLADLDPPVVVDGPARRGLPWNA
jgi:hypothetical protein